jgi:glycerophosphoryl diester phosphodiesterase
MRPAALLAVATLFIGRATAVLAGPPDEFLHNGVTAHRGNAGEHPENTIPAFRSAIELGADWVELDVFRTRDGKLVISHDRTTGRVGDKDLVVPESTYEELRAVDVATGFRREQGRSIKECPRHSLPLLEDALRLILTQNRTRVSIHPKMDCVAETVALVKRLQAEKWTGFNDTHLPWLAKAKELLPKAEVFWDRNQTNLNEDIRLAQQHGFGWLVLQRDLVTEARVRAIHEAGLKAGAWTVNDEAGMKQLLDLGMDRIYTDYPGRLLTIKRERARYRPTQCEGAYPRHLQGICIDGQGAIYWSFTDVLLKSDVTGKVIKQRPVANHHGDLCYQDGKLYVAVNLGKFNELPGKADSWVYVYDADSLAEAARHKVPEAVHGAGGIGWHNGHFMVVGGLPPGVNENYVYEYDEAFRFIRKHIIQSGYTLMGIQTAEFINGCWWFGCYGNPRVLLKTDETFHLVGRYEFDCALGLAGLPDGRFLVAQGPNGPGKKHVGSVVIAHADATKGLVVESDGAPGK